MITGTMTVYRNSYVIECFCSIISFTEIEDCAVFQVQPWKTNQGVSWAGFVRNNSLQTDKPVLEKWESAWESKGSD